MSTLRIAVGSARRPKVDAVREAVDLFGQFWGQETNCKVVGYEVESGVSHTPRSREELMQGARLRAEALREMLRNEGLSVEFFVGLEGGLDVVTAGRSRTVFLQSWAYVSDGQRGHFGCSGSIELPAALADEVLLHGVELAQVIDEFAGAVGIRDRQGAWGVLSRNLISRQDSFRVAVVAAFAPFFNSPMYRRVSTAAG
jgi:inosine/xanthosine triphosphatase